jgi:predicted transcriptional regulator
MKTEKAIQVLRDYNLWRRGNEDMDQPDPWCIGEAIDSVLVAIQKTEAELDEERKEGEEQARLLGMGSEREAKLIAERDLWRAEAQRWREQALDLEAQIETAIKRLQWRQDNLDRGIKELKSGY